MGMRLLLIEFGIGCLLIGPMGCAGPGPRPLSVPSKGSGTYRPYTIKGKSYRPLRSAKGFSEQGVASWYGSDFHGRRTANGEKYNMYAMTAAHRTLPMQTRVLVTNLRNNRQVTVRINDRGPFVKDRILDLSYSAAKRLDLVTSGTAPVRIQALEPRPRPAQGRFYIQTGSYRHRDNALEQRRQMRKLGYGQTRIAKAYVQDVRVWRVQVGVFPSLKLARTHLERLRHKAPSCFILAD
jgi:rare lipoprotein A